jgi:hypothetical protein
MKKALVLVLFLFLSFGFLSAEDILVGTAFILDGQGNVEDAYDLTEEGFPIIELVEIYDESENSRGEAEGALYYQKDDALFIENVTLRFPEGDLYYIDGAVEIESETLGYVHLIFSGEVMADELWAEISSYRIQFNREWYTGVGVVAMLDFQQNDEQDDAFAEITGDVKEDYMEENSGY